MKKLSKAALFLFVATLSLTSCSKSDSDGASTSGNIVAKWEYSKQGAILNGQEALTDYPNQAGCSKDFIEFKADLTAVDGSYDADCILDTYNYTYTKSGNTLTNGDGEVATILQLDSSVLKIKTTYDDGNGTSVTGVVVFKKASN